MAYLTANTSTSNGWRPNTLRLGELRMARRFPNWKDSAGQMAASTRKERLKQVGLRRAAQAKASLVDAQLRRVKLAGLGALDPGTQMQPGQNYTFHFQSGAGFLGSPDPEEIRKAVSTDGNFSNVSAGGEGNAFFGSNFYVSFTYTGQGATVLGAGSEMAQVIGSHLQSVWGYTFVSADGPGGGNSSLNYPSGSGGSGLNYPQGSGAPKDPLSMSQFLQQNWGWFFAAAAGLVLVNKL